MKIRTITTGFNLKLPLKGEQFKRIAEFTIRSKREFENKGYIVQTARISTQPWEEHFKSREQVISLAKDIEALTKKHGLDLFSMGTAKNPENIPVIYDIISNTSNGFCSVTVSDDKEINFEAARQTAKLVKRISRIEPGGFANRKFTALFNVKPGSPFFPASYHRGPPSFAIGTENSDLVFKAFSRARDIEKARPILKKMFTYEYNKVEAIAKEISRKENIRYGGIDVSIATSVNPKESIAYAFEKLGLGRFGEAGTLAVAKIVTDTLKSLDVKKCGYSGLMLPVLEDYGLVMRNKEGTYNLANLLLYSAVCGTGLDTIPLPGDVSEEKLYALLLDIASLSIKLGKPLSARLMPVPNKNAGDMTEYGFEYFVNSKIMGI